MPLWSLFLFPLERRLLVVVEFIVKVGPSSKVDHLKAQLVAKGHIYIYIYIYIYVLDYRDTFSLSLVAKISTSRLFLVNSCILDDSSMT